MMGKGRKEYKAAKKKIKGLKKEVKRQKAAGALLRSTGGGTQRNKFKEDLVQSAIHRAQKRYR